MKIVHRIDSMLTDPVPHLVPMYCTARTAFIVRRWLGGIRLRCWTYGREVVGSASGQVAIKWLLLGWVTVTDR